MMRLCRDGFFFLVGAAALSAASLKTSTADFYQTYLLETQKKLEQRKLFLLIDSVPAVRNRVKGGEVFVEERRPRRDPPDGLIHHWEGAVFIPSASVSQILTLVQNYDQHKNVYKPEVIDSQLLRKNGNEFQVRLRLLKKKVLTVVLETEHEVKYRPVDAARWESVSRTTKVSEVDEAGTSKERELPPGAGHGFVWRMDSFWRFLEADGGVYVECTSVSLSRDIPFGMGRIIRPIIDDLPEESLRNVLRQTRQALAK
jgi:hypothetical protein